MTPPATSQAHTAPSASQARPKSKSFRGDIQGLRAIAVGAVILFHLWPSSMRGGFVGVDVFFVISGFLITSHLMKRVPKAPKDFFSFWARRVRRLLPASLLVLTLTGLAAFLLLPNAEWLDTAKQIIASALYVQNWQLAFDSVDYLAADNDPTAVQHFWSLSVEEQFYFVWPIIIAVAAWGGVRFLRKRHTSREVGIRRGIGLALALVVIGSLAFSIWYTSVNPAMAYFVTPTRMWQLALGGVVAYVMFNHKEDRPGLGAAVFAWAGLIMLLGSIFLIRESMPFPGYVAIFPVVGTAMVIGAHATHKLSPTYLLELRPARFLGDVSYSAYLWHWPLIILAPGLVGDVRWYHRIIILVLTLVLAWLSKELVEDRFRQSAFFSRNLTTYIAGAACMVVAVGSGGSLMATAKVQTAQSEQRVEEALESDCSGAGVLPLDEDGKKPIGKDGKPCPVNAPLVQDPVDATDDKSDAYEDECWSDQPFNDRPTCTYGDGKKHVALIGNSHAGHWLPAVQKLAEERDWTVTTFLVSRCNVTDAKLTFKDSEGAQNCHDYGQWVKKQTTSGKFDAVITSERQSVPVEGNKSLKDSGKDAQKGYTSFLKAWEKAGLDVMVIREVPVPGKSLEEFSPECVANNGVGAKECQGTPSDWKWMDPLADEVKRLKLKNQAVVDPEPWICPDGTCQSDMGGLITYFDDTHITASFAESLSDHLNHAIKEKGLSKL